MENNTTNISNKLNITSPDNSKKPMWLKYVLHGIVQAAKRQPVLTIAIIAMLITCFFVPVDAHYLDYFNWATLATLYCTLAVVEALSNIHVFEIISRSIVLRLRNLRNATFGLVFITFIGSMFLANDMALLTFLPLGYFVLTSTDKNRPWPLPLLCKT